MLGTGMTMVDVALTLGGGAGGRGITAVSRRGELPRAHRAGASCDAPEPVVRPGPGLTADGLAAASVDAARPQPATGARAVDSLRPVTPELWRSLPPRGAARASSIGTPAAGRSTAAARRPRRRPGSRRCAAAGALRVEAAAIRALRPGAGRADRGRARRRRRARGRRGGQRRRPAWDCRRGDHALLRELIERGIAAPGPLGLGLRTDPGGALVDRAGRPSSALFTLGALRRGELWETVAVPELSAQACALAEPASRPWRPRSAACRLPLELFSLSAEQLRSRAAGSGQARLEHEVQRRLGGAAHRAEPALLQHLGAGAPRRPGCRARRGRAATATRACTRASTSP